MILTPSEVASVSTWVKVWEFCEYAAEALVFLGCVGEYIAEYTKLRTEEWRHGIGRRSLVILIAGLGFGLLALIKTNALSGIVIDSIGQKAEHANQKAQLATEVSDAAAVKAKSASEDSDRARIEAGTAKDVAANAHTLARGARQEADSFEKEIRSATKQAGEAESHLKDALARAEAAAELAKGYEKQIGDATRDASEAKSLLAEARQMATEARQQAGEATSGVNRLRADRFLNNPRELSAKLRDFEKTEYTFAGVFADAESIQLLKLIDNILTNAGWKRVKAVHAFPSYALFGGDDDVHGIVATGIKISVDSSEPIANLERLPIEKLPVLVRAAVMLHLDLCASLYPPEKPEDRPVGVQLGTSSTIRIIVGKKP